jgi:hypothetical protein
MIFCSVFITDILLAAFAQSTKCQIKLRLVHRRQPDIPHPFCAPYV